MRCAQSFERFSAAHIREFDLTPAQFDIIATLGNTSGMSCKELGEKTLITKGTLTGVLDRLEARGLLTRSPSAADGRSWLTALTTEGQTLFERIFPLHTEHLANLFQDLTASELQSARLQLIRLREAFERANPITTESS